ncbi:MAG: hypothetical protein M1817_000670 [Caeruleum heppii]|nr:MAG: hypothetical protein M1817_000670 [Caeruleum heppii]
MLATHRIGHQEWVQDWMDELLKSDTGYILEISLYVVGEFNKAQSKYGDRESYGQHNRIKKFFGLPDIRSLLNKEMKQQKGKLLISGQLMV